MDLEPAHGRFRQRRTTASCAGAERRNVEHDALVDEPWY
jgi:hypothetical protein